MFGFTQAKRVGIQVELPQGDPVGDTFAEANPVLAIVRFVELDTLLQKRHLIGAAM